MMKVKAIGFDRTGVLVGMPASKFNQLISEISNTDIKTFQSTYYKFNNDFNTGKISKEELWKKVLTDLGKMNSFDEVMKVVNRPKELNTEIISLVKELKEKGYRVGLLSNDTSEAAKYMREVEHLDKFFDVMLVSAETGYTKPNKDAYMDFVNKLGVSATELIFIDDSQVNLISATKLGISTILYSDPNNLRNQLLKKGVLLTDRK